MTAVYGVMGWPVAHSRSPAIHNAAFAVLQVDAVYVPYAVPPERLGRAVEAARALGLSGWNVTLPHKSAIMPFLSVIEPAATAIGAVNTVLRDGERLIGANTDAEGLTRSLREAGVWLQGARAVVLGAGGAARATVVGLAAAGVAEIAVAARREEAAEGLVTELRAHCAQSVLTTSDLATGLATACTGRSLLIQATSATLASAANAQAFADALPLRALAPGATVCDLVYKPRETALLGRARSLGLPVVDGLGMLLHQGALAFERWTGLPAPLGAMRSAL
ncbi:MAG: shikimate dehydrogenase [Polyangiales bacterium]